MGVTDAYAYDAWGNGLAHFGSAQQPYQYVGRLGYYAHYQNPAFGLVQLGARYYEPGIGRFISRDPIGYEGGLNLYAYVGNRPVVRVDPKGLVPIMCVPIGTSLHWDYELYDTIPLPSLVPLPGIYRYLPPVGPLPVDMAVDRYLVTVWGTTTWKCLEIPPCIPPEIIETFKYTDWSYQYIVRGFPYAPWPQ